MPNTAKTFTSNISPKTMSMSKQCFFFLFLCIFFVLLSFHGVDSTFSTICSETLCNGVKIRYPFWKVPEPQIGNATRNVFCGYRGFGLNCSTDSKTFPILNLPGDTYYVKDINYDNESITLVDIDAYGQNCPRVRHNVTVETLPLYFRSEDSMNLSFYFNCSSEGYGNDFLQSTNQISCLDTGGSGNRSFVIEEGMEVAGFDWTMWCQDKVVAAVKESELAREGLVTGFVAAMNAGFVLDWGVAMNCSKCEEKKGRCGFNNRTGAFVCFCDNSAMLTDGKICKSGGGMNILPKVFIVTGSIIGAILSIAIIFHCLRKQSPSFIKSHRDIEKFIKQHGSFAPKRFSYPEVRKMTNSFTIKLGQGGFGTVYKGKLLDGTLVAVKLLSSSKGNGEEFINEVASISRTSHVNVVTLLGFCFKGNKRALIYEFMSNGSLDRFIHDDRNTARTCTQLGWERLSQIAVGIARGLEYLHRGCTTRILHFDIKPHNILLDEDFCPKISDFGLSKLCLKKESIVSMLDTRGTIGYIAPEVFNKNFGGVSYKSDVYSYGMLLIEIVGGKNEFATEGGRSSSVYFPDQIYRRLEVGHCLGPQDHKTTEENEIVRKMTVVGLWCIQTLPSQRPTMSKVIELLEGSTEALQIPPKPTLSTPPRSSEDYLSTSVLL